MPYSLKPNLLKISVFAQRTFGGSTLVRKIRGMVYLLSYLPHHNTDTHTHTQYMHMYMYVNMIYNTWCAVEEGRLHSCHSSHSPAYLGVRLIIARKYISTFMYTTFPPSHPPPPTVSLLNKHLYVCICVCVCVILHCFTHGYNV